MFLPLGLFLRLKRMPIITILIIVTCTYVHIFVNKANSDLGKHEKKYRDGDYMIVRSHLFSSYCLSRGIEAKKCQTVELKPEFVDKSKKPEKPQKKDVIDTDKNNKKKVDFSKINVFEEMNQRQRMYDIQQEFSRLTQSKIPKNSPLRKLKGFDLFHKEHIKLLNERNNLTKKHNLLSRETIGVFSVILAMFSHSNFAHLFGNMFGLLVFGIYVEARIGALEYLVSYILGGAIGLGVYVLTLSDPHQFIVGASANVFAVMGMFFIFFRDKPMKFFVFYIFAKVVNIPVRRFFFILFILLEIILVFSNATNVAHGAHVLGLIVGVAYAYFWNKRNPLPKGFLYKSELEWYNEFKSKQGLSSQILIAQNLLRYNPYNNHVRNYILNSILEESQLDPDLLLKYQKFVERELSVYLLDMHKEHEDLVVVHILKRLPSEFNVTEILKRFFEKDLIEILDYSIKDKEYYLSLRVIGTICDKYKRSKQLDNYLKTGESILKNKTFELSQLKNLVIHAQSRKYKNLIIKYIERSPHGKDL